MILSKENQENRWINFEAGALAKVVDASRVVPFPVNLDLSEIRQPLGQFQAKELTYQGILSSLEMINERCENKRPPEQLKQAFEPWWPKIESAIQQARDLRIDEDLTAADHTLPDQNEILSEILTTVRQLARDHVPEPSSPAARFLAGQRIEPIDVLEIRRALNVLVHEHDVEILDTRVLAPGIVDVTVRSLPTVQAIRAAQKVLNKRGFELRFTPAVDDADGEANSVLQ